MMDVNESVSDAKYHRLASEYSKLRAQASVLRKAVLDEQSKNVNFRASLRRAEQEVDSLGFRNKQLEHRVGALQEEIATLEAKKKQNEKEQKRTGKTDILQQVTDVGNGGDVQDVLLFEELQKKILENAQLTLLVDDKEHDLLLYSDRIRELEEKLAKSASEQREVEKRLRRDIEMLQIRNSELESKLIEAASMMGSEDGSDNNSIHNNQYTHTPSITSIHTNEDRIAYLEKEIAYWRSQFEVMKLSETNVGKSGVNFKEQQHKDNMIAPLTDLVNCDQSCGCSSTAAGLTVKPSYAECKNAQKTRDSFKEPLTPPTKEQILYNHFCRKYEDLLKSKYAAESRLSSFESEAEHLQNCLENATYELKLKDEHLGSMSQALQMLEEDLTTTRLNYGEQISVLTEQVISLSEQLASK